MSSWYFIVKSGEMEKRFLSTNYDRFDEYMKVIDEADRRVREFARENGIHDLEYRLEFFGDWSGRRYFTKEEAKKIMRG